MNKKFLYYPSLSAGSMMSAFKKDLRFEDGVTTKFYHETYPEKWRHPAFLITAGHYYKKAGFRESIDLADDVLVFGDSGGFQIATGALEYKPAIREQIFHWLEDNSDVAANLDIPPRAMYENRFQEAMDLSFDNFKYFETNQSGKTKFLNVLQGTNPEEYTTWYNKFKDFDFNGWCIGGPRKLVDFMFSVALFLENREFEKPHIEYAHFLGISKISDFFVLAIIQNLLNKLTDNRILVSTDSSSPGQYPVFGTYLHSANYKTGTFSEAYFPKNGEYRRITQLRQGKADLVFDATKHVPCTIDCPACKDFTFEYLGGQTKAGLDRYTQEGMPRMVIHNTHLYVKVAEDMNQLAHQEPGLYEKCIPRDLYNVILGLHEMFEDPDSALHTYDKYKKTFKKFGGDSISTINTDTAKKFFTFK